MNCFLRIWKVVSCILIEELEKKRGAEEKQLDARQINQQQDTETLHTQAYVLIRRYVTPCILIEIYRHIHLQTPIFLPYGRQQQAPLKGS